MQSHRRPALASLKYGLCLDDHWQSLKHHDPEADGVYSVNIGSGFPKIPEVKFHTCQSRLRPGDAFPKGSA